MSLNRPGKVGIGILTLWPLLYMLVFFGFVVYTVFFLPLHGKAPQPVFSHFQILFGLHLLTILETMGLLAFYISYIFKTDRIPQDKKALWAVVVVLGNMLAMQVFWYRYIWPEPVEFFFVEE